MTARLTITVDATTTVTKRRIFPIFSACPMCGRIGHETTGKSNGGGIVYRRCLHCAEKYKVTPLAIEELHPDGPRLRVLVS